MIVKKLVAALLLLCAFAPVFLGQTSTPVYKLTTDDEAFLEDLEKRSFMYLWEQSNPANGLTLDRAGTNGKAPEKDHPSYNIASIGATGFALSGLCIASERKWLPEADIKTRAKNTLRFFADKAFEKNGWFYHWLDYETGERRWNSEISSIDTTLLLGGVLTVRGCFAADKEIVKLATKIYDRVDFRWMLNGTKLFSHGWRPEEGFLRNDWHDYSEQMALYFMALGSPTHTVEADVWKAWKRDNREYYGYKYVAAVSPLFIHQFAHAFVDFRGKREKDPPHLDLFQNSVNATYAQRAFFIELSKEFPKYGGNMWGLSASDRRLGYIAWGAPPREPAIDGTVVPYAPAGSLMFAPEITLPVLKEIKAKYPQTYGRYGFTDAFNPQDGWLGPDNIGIDIGITLLSAENLRTGNVWKWFMKNKEIGKGLKRAGIR